MVKIIKKDGNISSMDFIERGKEWDYELIDGVYFEKRVEQKQEKKVKESVAVEEKTTIASEVVVPPMPQGDWPTDDELRAFLKELNVKGRHVFGRAKLIAKAEENGFIFNK